MKKYIKFYPVDNGDSSIINLEGTLTILVDCNIRQASIGSTNPAIFDVRKDILESIKRRNGIPYTDVFILTHGDCDHCRGFKQNFYQGDPVDYTKEDLKAEKIMIDEMWFSPMIAEEHTNDDEDAYQQEAERRLALHLKGSSQKDKPGNRIKIVGYDGKKDYSALSHLRAIPGTVVQTFNNVKPDGFSVFIHAPFKEHLTSAEKDKNSTSIVFQARFKANGKKSEFTALAIFAGDSDHLSWEVIVNKTRQHRNDVNERALDWDLFLAPHHCSWTFFNNTPQDENSEPSETSLEVLDFRRPNAMVIASSKEVLNDDDNPPHYAAKSEYVKKVGAANFLNTAIEPSKQQPLPIVFEITDNGVSRADSGARAEDLRKVAKGISLGAIGTAASGKLAPIADNVIKHQPHRFYGEK